MLWLLFAKQIVRQIADEGQETVPGVFYKYDSKL